MNANKALFVFVTISVLTAIIAISCGGKKNSADQMPELGNKQMIVPVTQKNLLQLSDLSEQYTCRADDCRSKGAVPDSDEPAIPKVEHSTFTDTRDSKVYKSVKINNQVWMAENLNYMVDSSWCYDNADSNCVKYGRLYSWDVARNACPAGWRLPDIANWDNMVNVVGGLRECDDEGLCQWSVAGTKLKSKVGWDSCAGEFDSNTNDFGFSALPGGYRNTGGHFRGVGTGGSWWSATEDENDDDRAYSRHMRSCNGNSIVDECTYEKNNGFSLRCVNDSD